MPNWVTNKLYLKHAEDAKYVLRKDSEVYNDEGMTVDFNILVPYPAELDITGGYTKPADEPDDVDINIPIGKMSMSKYVDKCVAAGFSAYAAEYEYKTQKFGSPGWYSWCVDHWGTKWNAHNVDKADASDVIIFDTAWGYPDKWCEELAKHADFTLLYADEDTGSNCGWITCEGGKVTAFWDTDEVRRRAHTDHFAQACAMSLYVHGWLYDYTDSDARDNLIISYGLDDIEYLKESKFARTLLKAYDNLPQLLTLILPDWLQEEEDLDRYARK